MKQKTKEILSEGNLSSYFEGAIQRMIDENEFKIEIFDIKDMPWVEVDYEEDYRRAVELFSQP